MVFKFEKYNKGEINIPLIYFLVLAFSALTGFIIVKFGLMPHMKCQFKEFTGYPCPTCGTTRLVLSLYNFDLLSAFKYNPFMFVFGVFLGLWSLSGFLPILVQKKLVILITKREKKLILILIIVFFFLNWLYLILAGI